MLTSNNHFPDILDGQQLLEKNVTYESRYLIKNITPNMEEVIPLHALHYGKHFLYFHNSYGDHFPV